MTNICIICNERLIGGEVYENTFICYKCDKSQEAEDIRVKRYKDPIYVLYEHYGYWDKCAVGYINAKDLIDAKNKAKELLGDKLVEVRRVGKV